MRKLFPGISTIFLCITVAAQDTTSSIENYFQELRNATVQNKALWGKDLYAPVLMVEPSTRRIFANYPDSTGTLRAFGKLYFGFLPEKINIANTAVEWSGRRWAMIMLPLPADKNDRLNLFAHELFHVAQPALGFSLFNPDNNHLDKKEGRVYLRLELEALLQAIQAEDKMKAYRHLQNALLFRKYRQSLFPGSDSSENLLELNEGVAEYTGLVISARNNQKINDHFSKATRAFFSSPTFVRSFAYHTIPMYGYLLKELKNKAWNKEISANTNLSDYFIRSFSFVLPANSKITVDQLSQQYNNNNILSQETLREEKQLAIVSWYKKIFIEQPHLTIHFEKMNVSFDPGNITPLDDNGTVYPTIRVTDSWGILTVTKGALMGSNWDRITLTAPLTIAQDKITGDGWTIDLNTGYHVTKNEPGGNYQLIRK